MPYLEVPATIDRARLGAARALMLGANTVRYFRGDPLARLAAPPGRADPYPGYRQIREAGAFVPTMAGPMSTRHGVVDAVLRDHGTFGSGPVEGFGPPMRMAEKVALWIAPGDDIGEVGGNTRFGSQSNFTEVPDALGPESLLGMDPPTHTRLRRLTSRAFTPRAIATVRTRVEEVAVELLDQAGTGSFEIMSGYAGVLPVVVISELLGVPRDDWAQLKRWGDAVASSLDVMGGAPETEVAPARQALGAYLIELFADRRRQPGERVVDTLIAGTGGDDGLTDRELLATAVLLLVAGFETTINLVGSGVAALLAHPGQMELLRADPGLTGNLVEEVLRYEAPVQMTARIVRHDTELEGTTLPTGTQVLVSLGGANRDPEVFADPDRFDITRPNARSHLSFSAGVHHCLGAALARLEGEVALGTLVRRYPQLALDGPVEPGRGLILRGPSRLPVRLGPVSAESAPEPT